jgi:hypothetical protein
MDELAIESVRLLGHAGDARLPRGGNAAHMRQDRTHKGDFQAVTGRS